jgi:hypothetical protein
MITGTSGGQGSEQPFSGDSQLYSETSGALLEASALNCNLSAGFAAGVAKAQYSMRHPQGSHYHSQDSDAGRHSLDYPLRNYKTRKKPKDTYTIIVFPKWKQSFAITYQSGSSLPVRKRLNGR